VKGTTLAIACFVLTAHPVLAHHGVASLGAAGFEGPGAPVETSTSATLPEGSWLAYLKADHVKYETFHPDPAYPESDFSQYWMLGLGYGIEPWLSAYVFQPYNIKTDEPGGLDSRGFTDLALMGVVGFKYDEALMPVPANESLDDLTDWHFTIYGGLTLPTGDADHRLDDGSIDPGKSLGFGEPSFIYGATATKQFSENATAILETGQIRFQEYRYDDGQTMKFGTETRVNAALAYRLMANPGTRFRLDGIVETNYLHLGRDESQDGPEPATGGDMLYGVLGLRLYQDNLSVGLAVKRPVWKDLNEEDEQQGAEGKEQYRLIATFSALF
jgi:hypothetical protein